MRINEIVLKNEERVSLRLRELYRSYGYTQYKMSKFEEYDLYARNKDFLISDNVITFTDTNGKLMALKPDVTLSIVKNTKAGEGLRKVYYDENVYRVSDGSHAYREIAQTGLECIGDVDDYAIAEVLMLAAESLSRISGDYVLDVSELDIVSAVIDSFNVDRETRSALLTAVGEKNLHTISALAANAAVPAEKATLLQALIELQGDSETVITALRAMLADTAAMPAVERLARIMTALKSVGCDDRIHIDFSVVDDMNYYNGIVFKGFVNGVPTGVLSGGQYDRLMKKMGKQTGAIGFAVYLDLLERLHDSPKSYDVDVLVLYNAQMPAAALLKAARALGETGESVLLRTAAPADVRYRRVVDLTKGDC